MLSPNTEGGKRRKVLSCWFYDCSPAFIKNPISREGDWRGLCRDLQTYCRGAALQIRSRRAIWQRFASRFYCALLPLQFSTLLPCLMGAMRVPRSLLFSACHHFTPVSSKLSLFFQTTRPFRELRSDFNPMWSFSPPLTKGWAHAHSRAEGVSLNRETHAILKRKISDRRKTEAFLSAPQWLEGRVGVALTLKCFISCTYGAFGQSSSTH